VWVFPPYFDHVGEPIPKSGSALVPASLPVGHVTFFLSWNQAISWYVILREIVVDLRGDLVVEAAGVGKWGNGGKREVTWMFVSLCEGVVIGR